MYRRRITAMLTAISLLLSALVMVVWGRSLTVADWLSYSNATSIGERYARTDWIVLSAYGFLSFTKAEMVPVDETSATWLIELDQHSGLGWRFGPVDEYSLSWGSFTEGLGRIGFSSGTDALGRTRRNWRSFEVPAWLLLVIFSIPAQFALLRFVRAKRARRRAGFPVGVPAPAMPQAPGDGS